MHVFHFCLSHLSSFSRIFSSDIDAKFTKRDRFSSNRLVDFCEKKDYNPDVRIDYIDSFGCRLNEKEAFSELSYRFHGKPCGKGKIDKILKERKLELVY